MPQANILIFPNPKNLGLFLPFLIRNKSHSIEDEWNVKKEGWVILQIQIKHSKRKIDQTTQGGKITPTKPAWNSPKAFFRRRSNKKYSQNDKNLYGNSLLLQLSCVKSQSIYLGGERLSLLLRLRYLYRLNRLVSASFSSLWRSCSRFLAISTAVSFFTVKETNYTNHK